VLDNVAQKFLALLAGSEGSTLQDIVKRLLNLMLVEGDICRFKGPVYNVRTARIVGFHPLRPFRRYCT
jgi:hypothetical protein